MFCSKTFTTRSCESHLLQVSSVSHSYRDTNNPKSKTHPKTQNLSCRVVARGRALELLLYNSVGSQPYPSNVKPTSSKYPTLLYPFTLIFKTSPPPLPNINIPYKRPYIQGCLSNHGVGGRGVEYQYEVITKATMFHLRTPCSMV